MSKKVIASLIVLAGLGLAGFFIFHKSTTPVAPIPKGPSLAGTAADPIKIQYHIKVQTEIGEFNDSLYFTPEEWTKLTQEELAQKIKARVDNWVNSVKHPAAEKAPAKPSKEELQIQADQLKQQLDQINAQIAK